MLLPALSLALSKIELLKVEPDRHRYRIELQEMRVDRLKQRIARLEDGDPKKPELLEELGDMLWQNARLHALRWQEFQAREDMARERVEIVNSYMKSERAMQALSDELMQLYRDLIENYPKYPQIDRVRYNLAFLLAEMGNAREAREQYEAIARKYPNAKYSLGMFSNLGKRSFREAMPRVLQQYQKSEGVDLSVHKMGWCYFNLGDPQQVFEKAEKAVGAHGTWMKVISPDASKAVDNLIKAYSMWDQVRPEDARRFFESLTWNQLQVEDMMLRLARSYAACGRVEDSNVIYEQLIAESMGKSEAVVYQLELMRNLETLAFSFGLVQESELVQAIDRAARLFVKARNEPFEGSMQAAMDEVHARLGEFTRDIGKLYHGIYRRTEDPLYYALASEVYRTYLENFHEENEYYDILYYYADMMYWEGQYAEAAEAFDRILDLNEQWQFSKDAAHGAALAYHKLIKLGTDKEACPDIPEVPMANPGEAQVYPEYPIADCRLKFIEASKRWARIDASSEHASGAKYTAAQIYFDHHHFEAARQLFAEIIQENPEYDLAVNSANYLLDSYKLKGECEGMHKAIAALKSNVAFMANSTSLMSDFKEMMVAYEKALCE